jgi:TonB family protein
METLFGGTMQTIGLLESERAAPQAGFGSAASIALHVVVLAFAIAATSHARNAVGESTALYRVLPRFSPPVVAAPHARERTQAPARRNSSIPIPFPTVTPVTVSTPSIGPIVATSVGSQTAPLPGGVAGGDTSATPGPRTSPFDEMEVDVPASALPGQRGPAYPERLRANGVEGRVVARFIIGKDGRIEGDPVIVSATADEFAAAVKRYLAGTRYRAAMKNGEPVRQLAEQEFDFAMRR